MVFKSVLDVLNILLVLCGSTWQAHCVPETLVQYTCSCMVMDLPCVYSGCLVELQLYIILISSRVPEASIPPSAVLSHRQTAAIHTEEATHPKQLQKQRHMCIARVCDCHVCFTHPLEKLFARRPSPIATSWAHSRRPGSTVLTTEVTLCTCSFRVKLEQAQR